MLHQDERETKATFRIENSLYKAVVDKLNWSQPTLLFRKLWLSLKEKIDSGKKKELLSFMYGEDDLVLKNVNEKKKDKD